jgi:hypothetical protein
LLSVTESEQHSISLDISFCKDFSLDFGFEIS